MGEKIRVKTIALFPSADFCGKQAATATSGAAADLLLATPACGRNSKQCDVIWDAAAK